MKEKRTRNEIMQSADDLFYQQGFEHTSFTDIAAAVRISRGNFYHHFKTKDEILDAVIDARLARTRAMLDQWSLDGVDATARIQCFIHILLRNQVSIMRYGCPVGSLCMELAKLNHIAKDKAGELFVLFRDWLRQQFTAMGHGQKADALAMHLLGRSQGVATLANTFHDDAFIRSEVEGMCHWVRSLAPAGTNPPR